MTAIYSISDSLHTQNNDPENPGRRLEEYNLFRSLMLDPVRTSELFGSYSAFTSPAPPVHPECRAAKGLTPPRAPLA